MSASGRDGKRKWLLLFLLAGLIIGRTVVELSVHFTKATNRPDVKDHVLMLSTAYFTNVSMVFGLDGESVLQFYCLLYLHIIIVTRILSSTMSHNL